MAILKCKECGGTVSSTAKACPVCGTKPPRKTTRLTWLLLIMIGVIAVAANQGGTNSSPTAKKPSPEQTRIQKIEAGFSAWDGSHRQLERWIKKNLKDPDSYEHIETRYSDKGDHIRVRTQYRARNSFGGMTIGTVIATAKIDGDLVEIIASE